MCYGLRHEFLREILIFNWACFQNLVQWKFYSQCTSRCSSLMGRRLEHRAIFICNLLNNNFCHAVPISFDSNFHSYNTRSRNNICKYTANRTWRHWSSINFCSEIWNRLDISLRDVESLTSFKRGLSKAVLWSFLISFLLTFVYVFLDFLIHISFFIFYTSQFVLIFI